MRQFFVNQDSTARYTATITDENGEALAAADLTSLKLTLVNYADGSTINSRSAQDVLNQNGVTVDSNGLLTWDLSPEDNPLVNTEKSREQHRAIFEFKFDGGAKQGSHEFAVFVNKVGA